MSPMVAGGYATIVICPLTYAEGYALIVGCPLTYVEVYGSTERCPLTFVGGHAAISSILIFENNENKSSVTM